MDLIDDDIEDLLSRVLEETAGAAKPVAAAPRAPQREQTWTVPGILGSTRVMTSFGHVPAHLVRAGDSLRTRKGGFERVLRISEVRIDEAFLASRSDAAPVIIRRNGLGSGLPHQDVGLSPGQMVSVGANRFEDRLVPAQELSDERGGIDATLGMLLYVRFHLAQEARINCDGVWVAVGAD